MTATTMRAPLMSHNRRRRRLHLHPELQDKPSKPIMTHLPLHPNHTCMPTRDLVKETKIQESLLVDEPLAPSHLRASRPVLPEDVEDMWTLKRANPIFSDSDDENDEELAAALLYSSPTKRQRTTELRISDRIAEEPFSIYIHSE
jgi:hypothetical protein